MIQPPSQWLNHLVEAAHRQMQSRHCRRQQSKAGFPDLKHNEKWQILNLRCPDLPIQKLRHDSAEQQGSLLVSSPNHGSEPTDLGGRPCSEPIIIRIDLVIRSVYVYVLVCFLFRLITITQFSSEQHRIYFVSSLTSTLAIIMCYLLDIDLAIFSLLLLWKVKSNKSWNTFLH